MPGALTIARLQADCEVVGAPERAAAIADRTDSALRLHLPDSLRRAFAAWFDGNDESVWIVRRLDVSLAINADAAPDDIAATLTTAFARALAGTLHGDGAATLRFDDRAAYLSQFVVALAAGDAWNHWYYAPLAGVRLLDSSAAIRTVLIEHPARGLASLARLDDRSLARVMASISPQDERQLLNAFSCASRTGAEKASDVFEAAWTGWMRARNAGVDRGGRLFAFVRADGAPSVALFDAVCAIGDACDSGAIAQAGDPTAAPVHAAPVADAIPEWITQAIASLAQHDRLRTLAAWSSDTITTPFGGLLLLLRDLNECPWTEWTAGWPAPAAEPSSIVKWLVTAACSGRARALGASRDPALRLFFGIPPNLTFADAAQWLRVVGSARRSTLAASVKEFDGSAGPRSPSARAWLTMPRGSGLSTAWSTALASAAAVVLRRFARRLPGFVDSTPEHLWRNILDFDATLEAEPDRVVVRCGRPPLHLLLTLTGMTRGLLAGHDAQGRPWCLYARD